VTANPTSTTLLLSSPDAPPPYSAHETKVATADDDEKAALARAEGKHADPEAEEVQPAAEDTLHFLDHAHDSVASLSLAYGVPAPVLRRANRLTSDHLLAARRTVLIPGAFYRGGVSLSPRPVGGEREEARKARIRRFMVAAKVADYDVAVLYLDAHGDCLDAALDAYQDDERWERQHPLITAAGNSISNNRRGKGKSVFRRSNPAAAAAAGQNPSRTMPGSSTHRA
jgi:hypothetical protein